MVVNLPILSRLRGKILFKQLLFEKWRGTMKQQMLYTKKTGIIMTVLALLMAVNGAAIAGPKVYDLTLGTTSGKSGMYPWLAAHATEVNKRVKDIRVTAVETPGACVECAKRIYRGQMEMGWGASAQMYRAYNGLGEFKGKANQDLRAVATVVEVPFTIFVRKDSGITSMEGLNGKKFGTGFPASITGMKCRAFLDSAGIKPKFFEANLGANIEAVKNNSIVGFAKSGCPDSSILGIAATIPITILSMSKEQYAKFESKYPDYAEGSSIIPAGTYPGQTQDALAYAMFGTWQCTAKLPEDVVYKIVKSWYDARADLGGMYAAANKERGQLGFPKLTLETQKIPLHKGAVKFYRELGLTIPEKLLPPGCN
jgi:TRAP transporter TAXI family solute receptor